MTNKYTIEQIEAAIRETANCNGPHTEQKVKNIIAELTKPSWTPAVGEVYSYTDEEIVGRNPPNCQYGRHKKNFIPINREVRPLNSSEIPALAVAIEWIKSTEHMYSEPILVKITELTNV